MTKAYFFVWVSKHDCGQDGDVRPRFIALARLHSLHVTEDGQPAHHTAKHGVFLVQVWRGLEADEELGAVCVCARVRHRQHASRVM